MNRATSQRAQELASSGVAFVTATVVRTEKPTSARAGSVALVLADGTIEGFAGGACTEHSVRAYALQAIASGEPVLLRIVPFAPAGDEAEQEGAVTVENPCLSGGTLEVFLEPRLPAPRVLVVGDTPIAGALARLGGELDLDVVLTAGTDVTPGPGDLALVVAAHGRDELATLRAGLAAGLPYVGLVASRKRADGVLGDLRSDGVTDEQLARIDVPAGLWIGATTPSEIALSILASVVAARRSTDERPAASPAPAAVAATVVAATAVDPICGMKVSAVESTPHLQDGDETVYFCCEGCKATYARR
jgi:xanthine dehydrogenase accessory factor